MVFKDALCNIFIMFFPFMFFLCSLCFRSVVPVDLWPLTPKPGTVQREQTLTDCASSGTFFRRLSHRETFFLCQIPSVWKKKRKRGKMEGKKDRERGLCVALVVWFFLLLPCEWREQRVCVYSWFTVEVNEPSVLWVIGKIIAAL